MAQPSPPGRAAILDVGSATIKAGIAGERKPTALVPTVELPQKPFSAQAGSATSRARLVERGITVDLDGMERLWLATIHDTLQRSPKGQPLIITERVLTPRPNREKVIQQAIESLEVPSVYLMVRNVASLFASGLTSGLAVQSGDQLTTFVPIYESSVLTPYLAVWDFGGSDLTVALQRAVAERSNVSLTHAEADLLMRAQCEVLPASQAASLPEAVILPKVEQRSAHIANTLDSTADSYMLLLPRDVRESVARYHAHTPECERQPFPVASLRTPFTLPDGRQIAVDGAPLICAEGLFRPALIGRGDDGFHIRLNDTVWRGDVEERWEWIPNMVMAGGATLLPGFTERLHEELVRESYLLGNSPQRLRIRAPAERLYSSFIGASILGSLSTFGRMAISKEEYYEVGPSIVHRKCW